MLELARWDSFYVIVGSAAGALIGLQFVVMTLIAQNPPLRVAEAGPVFATPTIVYFGTGLLMSALLRAPWPAITFPAVLCTLIGLAGVVYAAITARRIGRQTAYIPDLEDRLFHIFLPLAGYGLLAGSGLAVAWYAGEALFGAGAAVLLLLFIGIHNTWDSTAYHVFVKRPGSDQKG
jgi:hypothetical protein